MFKTLKGVIGETKVRFYLFLLLGFRYTYFHNVTIGFPNGGSSQIDHLLIGKGGIFVIETKNYSGLIEGNLRQKYWTQNFGRKSYEFYNPVMQNESHLSALRYLLKSKDYCMYNIVVFVGDAEFKGRTPRNVFLDLFSCTCFIDSTPKTKLINQDIVKLKKTIKRRKKPNNIFTKKKHVRYVESRRNKEK